MALTPTAKTDIWMPLFIGDYLADTARLTTEQHGAYLLLIMDYWRNGPPPDDAAILCQITRLSPDAWSIAQAMLGKFFIIENGVWRHKRIDQELSAAGDKKEKAVDKAKAAATARWAKEQEKKSMSSNAPSNAPSISQAMLKPCPSPSPSPSPTLTTPDGVVSPSSVSNTEPLKNKTTDLIKTTVGETELQSACRETWGAYCDAYFRRYQVEPKRNATVNAQIKQFVQRIGFEESPQVAAFYVFNNAAFYVKKMHSVGMLLAEAEKHRTEWATNKRVTDTEARQADKTQAIGGVFQELIEEARERSAAAA